VKAAWLAAAVLASFAAQSPEGSVRLEPGKPAEREIKPGETHRYVVTLEAGQFLYVTIDQQAIPVGAEVFGPNGEKMLARKFSAGSFQRDPFSILAEARGDYRFEVSPIHAEAKPGRYTIAIRELRAATAADRPRLGAEALLAEAKQHHSTNSMDSFRKAIAKYRESLPLWREAKVAEWEAQTLLQIGDAHLGISESVQALDPLTQSLPLWAALGDSANEASALNKICIAHLMISQPLQGLEYCLRALPLAEKGPSRDFESSVLNNISAAFRESGQGRLAAPFERRGLELARTHSNERSLAIAINNRGVIQRILGNYHQALEYFRESLALNQKTKDPRGEAGTLDNIAETYRYLRDNPKALEIHQQALALWVEAKDQRGQAQSLNGIGLLHMELKQYDKALDYFTRSLPLSRAVKLQRMAATTVSNIGITYYRMKDYPRAIERIQEAAGLQAALREVAGQAVTLAYLGRAYAGAGDRMKARESLEQALTLARKVEHLEHEAGILAAMARIEKEEGNLGQARVRVEDAIRIFEELRARIAGRDLRAAYFAGIQDPFDLYVDILMDQHRASPAGGHDRTALEAVERVRSRSLLDALAESRVNARQAAAPALVEQEQLLQDRIANTASRQSRLLAGTPSAADAAKIKQELNTLLTELREVQARISAASPAYAAMAQPSTMQVEEVQKLLDPDSVLLEYHLGEERSYLWAVTPGSVASFQLPKRAEIEAAVRAFAGMLTTRNARPAGETPDAWRARLRKAEEDLPRASADLGKTLIGPAADLARGKRLLIVATGALQYLSFAALADPVTGGSLMAGHAIAYLPSASTAGFLRTQQAAREPARKLVAVLADPVFDAGDPRLRRNSAAPAATPVARTADEPEWERAVRSAGMSRLPRLTHSRDEARGILSLAGAGSSLQALDFEASRALAMSDRLAQYRIVHFASHGIIHSEHPELSGIVLSLVDGKGAPQDGFLRLQHIYNLKLPADLVVLSACQTALGLEIKGEGLVGLARGFMYAGASRVVASLWKVDDQATAELMQRFYRGMLGTQRLSATDALRAAQEAMRKQPRWQSPYYWAAFVLQGEWR